MSKRSETNEKISRELAELQTKLRNHPCHLPVIYQEQDEWTRHYYGLIWSIGTIILPASLAGLALDFRDDANKLNMSLMLTVCLASIVLLVFWWFLADWHRKMGDRSGVITRMILVEWGLCDEIDFTKTVGKQGPSTSHLLQYYLGERESRNPFISSRGKALRFLFIIGVFVLWGARVVSEWRPPMLADVGQWLVRLLT